MVNSSLQSITPAPPPRVNPGGNLATPKGTDLPEETDTIEQVAHINIQPEPEEEINSLEEPQVKNQDLTAATAEKLAETMNSLVKDVQRDLEFQVDNDSGQTVFKVIHTQTGEVIRQVPSEEAIAMAEALAAGKQSLIDDQA